MKTIKKLVASVFALVLGASLLAVPAVAFADVQVDSSIKGTLDVGTHVIDRSGLLFDSQKTELDAKADEVVSKYNVTPVYMIVDGMEGYSSASDYAAALIDAYGMDSYASGGSVLFLVCIDDSQYALVSSGQAAKTLTNETLDFISSDVSPYLGRYDWSGAGETFFGDIGQTMGGTTANSTSDVPYAGTYVTDNYGLFSDEQRSTLEAKAAKLAQDYNMGVYLLVVDNMGSQNPSSAERTNFATSFYRANDLGLGSGKDGIMLVIAPGSRDYVTIAYGQGSYSFSDEGIAAMEDAVKKRLGDDDWYGGSTAYYDSIGEQLDYYAAKGEPWTEPDPISLLLKILAILGIPGIVAFGKTKHDKDAMHTAREKSEASSYLDRSSFALTSSRDEFVNTTMTVTPIPKDDDNDSGGGFGGGGWGGGGGGGFSSSGGGKF